MKPLASSAEIERLRTVVGALWDTALKERDRRRELGASGEDVPPAPDPQLESEGVRLLTEYQWSNLENITPKCIREDDDPEILVNLLTAAVKADAFRIVSALLESGADINRGMIEGSHSDHAPIDSAASSGSPGMVQMLIERGADVVHARSHDSLMRAADRGHAGIVRLLLAAGADPTATGVGGSDALDYALEYRPWKKDPETAVLIRAALRERLAGKRGSSLRLKRHRQGFDISTDFGVSHFIRSVRAQGYRYWDLAFAEAGVEEVAATLVEQYPGARWEQHAENRLVEDGPGMLALVGFVGSPWTLLLGGVSQRRRELGDTKRFRQSCEDLSRAIAPREVLHVASHTTESFRDGALVSSVTEQILGPEDEDDDDTVDPEDELDATSDSMLRSRKIFLPPICWNGNGFHAIVEIRGIKKSDVSRLDIIVTKEF